MFVTGRDVVKAVTHEEVSKDELGGAYTHDSKSGVAHFLGNSEEEVLMGIREFLSFLPSDDLEDAPARPTVDDVRREDERLTDLIPSDPNVPYDVKELIESVADDNYFYEIMPHFAGQERGDRLLRPHGRAYGGNRGPTEPALLRRGARYRTHRTRRARFIRFCENCFQYPDHRAGRRPRVPSRLCAGTQRHHPPRSENRLRLHRSHRAENHAHSSQSLWRSLHRHVEQTAPVRT